MGRYWLFAGQRHYPRGGFKDFVASHDTILGCQISLAEWINKEFPTYPWWQVVDSTTGKIVVEQET